MPAQQGLHHLYEASEEDEKEGFVYFRPPARLLKEKA
jgi:hypothetical protein